MRCFMVLFFQGALCAVSGASDPMILYLGTAANGIYQAQFHPDDGSLTEPVMAAETARPTFLWIHPDGKTLYS